MPMSSISCLVHSRIGSCLPQTLELAFDRVDVFEAPSVELVVGLRGDEGAIPLLPVRARRLDGGKAPAAGADDVLPAEPPQLEPIGVASKLLEATSRRGALE